MIRSAQKSEKNLLPRFYNFFETLDKTWEIAFAEWILIK